MAVVVGEPFTRRLLGAVGIVAAGVGVLVTVGVAVGTVPLLR